MISVTVGRFPRAICEPPRANRMLVTKALPHDVAFLALVPLFVAGSHLDSLFRWSRRLSLQSFTCFKNRSLDKIEFH